MHSLERMENHLMASTNKSLPISDSFARHARPSNANHAKSPLFTWDKLAISIKSQKPKSMSFTIQKMPIL